MGIEIMEYLTVELDCTDDRCGKCNYQSVTRPARCEIFRKTLPKIIKNMYCDEYSRLPECINKSKKETVKETIDNFNYESELDIEVKKYIADPDTVVFINYNYDIGEYVYAVQVEDTEFWLNSFKTENEALEYIKDNNLKMI